MLLLEIIKERIFRKVIYSDAHNVIYKLDSKRYMLKNSGLEADIRLYSDNGRLVVLFKLLRLSSSGFTQLVNFSILYDKSENLDKFIIKHCNENPIFLIDQRDIPSIVKCTIDVDGSFIFINKRLSNQSSFETFIKDDNPNKTFYSFVRSKNEFFLDEAVQSNKNIVVVGSDHFQLLTLKKKKITDLIKKTTICCSCYSSDKLIDVFTIYEINNVVFVLNNLFDMTRLRMDKEWQLYTDTSGLENVVGSMFYYLHFYIDVTAPPVLFYRNSPCKLFQDKNHFIIEYIDGYYSSKVTIKISKHQQNDVVFESKEISRIDMNAFFYDIFRKIADKVFNICLNHPSFVLLAKLKDLGFDDCTVPLSHDIIEVIKMYDYE